jgi:hypothetical protein
VVIRGLWPQLKSGFPSGMTRSKRLRVNKLSLCSGFLTT